MKTQTTVLLFGGRSVARPLTGLARLEVADARQIDEVAGAGQRLVVAGSEADLASVLSRLMRAEMLDTEVAHVGDGPGRWLHARRAITGSARRVPLIRDDTGTALIGHAMWLPPAGSAAITGEAVIDDTVLFDGECGGVRIEPTPTMPGLRAAVLDGPRRRWVAGRAAQLGTAGARVIRDGVPGPREVKRSTFYRHITGWLRVG